MNLDAASDLESAELRTRFDPSMLDVQAHRRGSLADDCRWFLPRNKLGVIVIDASRPHTLTSGTGRLIERDFRVKPATDAGRCAIELERASLNEGDLTLNHELPSAEDPTDTLTVEQGRSSHVLDAAIARSAGRAMALRGDVGAIDRGTVRCSSCRAPADTHVAPPASSTFIEKSPNRYPDDPKTEVLEKLLMAGFTRQSDNSMTTE